MENEERRMGDERRGTGERAATQGRPYGVTGSFCGGPMWASAPTKGDGGCGLPRRPCGPPRNDRGERRTETNPFGPRGTGSAERSGERGKSSWSIRVLPDEGRVQHGAEGCGGLMSTPPVVTQGLPPTEQDSYEPRPAGWEGAPRPTARRQSVFSFDGSTTVSFRPRAAAARRLPPAHTCGRSLFGARQKENGGGIPAGDPLHLRLVNRPSAGRRGRSPAPTQGWVAVGFL